MLSSQFTLSRFAAMSQEIRGDHPILPMIKIKGIFLHEQINYIFLIMDSFLNISISWRLLVETSGQNRPSRWRERHHSQNKKPPTLFEKKLIYVFIYFCPCPVFVDSWAFSSLCGERELPSGWGCVGVSLPCFSSCRAGSLACVGFSSLSSQAQ